MTPTEPWLRRQWMKSNLRSNLAKTLSQMWTKGEHLLINLMGLWALGLGFGIW